MYAKNGGQERLRFHREIGTRLLILRKELHFTQEQMAELFEVSTSFYGMIERGERAPSIERLVIVYKKLGADITYLLTGDKKESETDRILKQCPEEKRRELKLLIDHALRLAEMK